MKGGSEGGRTCPSDCGNSVIARPLQRILLSMHVMYFSPECEACDELQGSAGPCSVTSISTGQLCLVHRVIGGGRRSCGLVATVREMQIFPVEENEPETRCLSYCSV